ncbi:MAG: DUF1343 domain-containing protein [Bacteroidetes bacterium]|nr:MAG: DUF1343 domain-containing protein [Bacteroidota bacterium]
MRLLKLGFKYTIMLALLLANSPIKAQDSQEAEEVIIPAAERQGAYLPLLYGKRVALVANHTAVVQGQHLADFLLSNKVDLKKVFAPEHGFRGAASAGETIKDGRDTKTNLPLISLYGKNKKPSAEQLADIDIIVFDIQDVGARFYTYISTMSYVMEAAAEQKKKVLILDRPNPNGYYVDGPVLELKHRSFVGMHQVPIVHGMTVGEYAKMLNGEGWLRGGLQCDLEVITCQNYDHSKHYELPIKPSPNLPNSNAISLYPSLCLFEGTSVSVGRGTELPFQIMGAPWFTEFNTQFTPVDREGAHNPKYEGESCKGFNLTDFSEHYLIGLGELYLYWLTESYKMAPDKSLFFTSFFTLLAGTEKLQAQIEEGIDPSDIHASWQGDLEKFKNIRRKYLLYADFE